MSNGFTYFNWSLHLCCNSSNECGLGRNALVWVASLFGKDAEATRHKLWGQTANNNIKKALHINTETTCECSLT